MSTKPETTFIKSIHRLLPQEVYRMKNNNPFIGGVPDCWYSGSANDLWVEYKFLPRRPLRGNVNIKLSALQLDWLNNRFDEGRNIFVIVGTPDGGVVLNDKQWDGEISAEWFNERLQTIEVLADRIVRAVS